MTNNELAIRRDSCLRRAEVVRPHFEEARRRYKKLDRSFTYWRNRAYEADLLIIGVTVIETGLTKDKRDRAMKQLLKRMSPQTAAELLKLLTGDGVNEWLKQEGGE